MAGYRVVSKNIGRTLFCADSHGGKMLCDAPGDLGGTNAAMSPPEALLAALANCMGVVVALCCQAKGIEYEGMEVEVTADSVDDGARMDNFVVHIKMPGPLDEAGKRTVRAAEKLCKVGITLKAGAKVSYLYDD